MAQPTRSQPFRPPSSSQQPLQPSQRPSDIMAGQNKEAGDEGDSDDDIQILDSPGQTPFTTNSGRQILTPASRSSPRPGDTPSGPKPCISLQNRLLTGPQIQAFPLDRGEPLHSQRDFGGESLGLEDGLMPVSPPDGDDRSDETADGVQAILPPPQSSSAILASPTHSTVSQSPSINSSLLSPSGVRYSQLDDLKKKKEFYKQLYVKCKDRKEHYKREANRLEQETSRLDDENGGQRNRIDELESSNAELQAELQRRPTAEQHAQLQAELQRRPTAEGRDRRLTMESYNELLEENEQLQIAKGAAEKKFHEKKEEARRLKAENERLRNASAGGASSSTTASPTITSSTQQHGEITHLREENERRKATIRRDNGLRVKVTNLQGEANKLDRVMKELAEAKSASTTNSMALEAEKKRSARLEEKLQVAEAASKRAWEEQSQLKSEFAKLRTTEQSHLKAASDATEKAAKLEAELKRVRKSAEQLDPELKEARDRAATLEAANAVLRDQLFKFGTAEQSLRKEAIESVQKAAKLEEELKEVREANGRLMHVEADLNQRVAELDTRMTAMEKELEGKNAESAEATSQIAQMQDRIGRMQDEKVECNGELVKMRGEKGQLEKQLEEERTSLQARQLEWDDEREYTQKCFDEAVQAMQRELDASHALHAAQRAELERLRRKQPTAAIEPAPLLAHQPTTLTPSNGPATQTLPPPTVSRASTAIQKKRGRKSNYDKEQEQERRTNVETFTALNLSGTWVKEVFERKTLSDHFRQSQSRTGDPAESPGAPAGSAASGLIERATVEQIEPRQAAPASARQPNPPISCEPPLRIPIGKRSQSVAKKSLSRVQGRKENASATATAGPSALFSTPQHAAEGDAPPVLSPAGTNTDTQPITNPPIDDENGKKRAAGSIEGAPEKRRRDVDVGGDGSGEGLEQPIDGGGEQPTVEVSSRTGSEREPAEKLVERPGGLQPEAVTEVGMKQGAVASQRKANHETGGDGKNHSGGETGADQPVNDLHNGQTQPTPSKPPADENGEGPSVAPQHRQGTGELLLSQLPGTSHAVLPPPSTDEYLAFESEDDLWVRAQLKKVFTDFYYANNELSFGDAIDSFMAKTGITDEQERDRMQIVLISTADELEKKFRRERDEREEGRLAETGGQQASVEASGVVTGIGQGSDEAAGGAVDGIEDLQHAATEAGGLQEGVMARLGADGGLQLQHPPRMGSGGHSTSETGTAQPANAHHHRSDKPQFFSSKASPAKQEPNHMNAEVPSVSPRQHHRSGGSLFELGQLPGTSREVSSPSNQSCEGDDMCVSAARAQFIADFTDFYLANSQLNYLKAIDEFLAGMQLEMSQEEHDEMRDILLCDADELDKSFRMQPEHREYNAPSAIDDGEP